MAGVQHNCRSLDSKSFPKFMLTGQGFNDIVINLVEIGECYDETLHD